MSSHERKILPARVEVPAAWTNANAHKEPACVYRCYNKDEQLLYVGCSNHVERRIWQHAKGSVWANRFSYYTVEHFSSRADARKAELDAIRDEKPLFNIAHARSLKRGVSIPPSKGPFISEEAELLVREIEEFCNLYGFRPSTVGQNACCNPRVYNKLTNGGSITYATAQRIRNWMTARDTA